MTGTSHTKSPSTFWIRLTNWEYWPFGVVQFPAILYWLWLSLRARTLLFFSASNPGIPMGGMFGESKFDILKNIPDGVKPKTVLVRLPTTASEVEDILCSNNFSLPVIFKPDLGERGFMVRKIRDKSEIETYVNQIKVDFIVQEFVDLPMEFGVFYQRYPAEKKGRVTSIVGKEMLTVEGDGQSTLEQLILSKDRAKLQWTKLKVRFADQLYQIVPAGKTIELVSIGNHAQGTKFLNANHLISPELSASFDHISHQVPGFNFGRFDLRCGSIEDLAAGKVRIMELNGCGAEPAHIYDPSFRLLDAMWVLVKHWRTIFEIAMENHKLGVPFVTLKDAKAYYRKFKSATKG